MANGTPCRCLLAESDLKPMAALVAEYVASLSEDEKAPEDTYRARLAFCQGCDELRNGTCRLCGCYVEARAAKKGQKCPMVPPLWEKQSE